MNSNACSPDYKVECECLQRELREISDRLETANNLLAEQSRTIAYLEGQIRGFEFCITKGGADNA